MKGRAGGREGGREGGSCESLIPPFSICVSKYGGICYCARACSQDPSLTRQRAGGWRGRGEGGGEGGAERGWWLCRGKKKVNKTEETSVGESSIGRQKR